MTLHARPEPAAIGQPPSSIFEELVNLDAGGGFVGHANRQVYTQARRPLIGGSPSGSETAPDATKPGATLIRGIPRGYLASAKCFPCASHYRFMCRLEPLSP